MPGRYAILSCFSTVQGRYWEPQLGGSQAGLENMVNGALKEGATLIGGVSVSASSKVGDGGSGSPFLIMTQAVLYPAGK